MRHKNKSSLTWIYTHPVCLLVCVTADVREGWLCYIVYARAVCSGANMCAIMRVDLPDAVCSRVLLQKYAQHSGEREMLCNMFHKLFSSHAYSWKSAGGTSVRARVHVAGTILQYRSRAHGALNKTRTRAKAKLRELTPAAANHITMHECWAYNGRCLMAEFCAGCARPREEWRNRIRVLRS